MQLYRTTPHGSEGGVCDHPGMKSLQLQSRLDDTGTVQSSRQIS